MISQGESNAAPKAKRRLTTIEILVIALIALTVGETVYSLVHWWDVADALRQLTPFGYAVILLYAAARISLYRRKRGK